jgi:hypothetical protein
LATRVRKTPAVTPPETPAEPAVTTRRRATTSRTATTRRVASSSRSQRILVGTESPLGESVEKAEESPAAERTETPAPAVVVTPEPAVVVTPEPAVVVTPEPAVPPTGNIEQKLGELLKQLQDGQQRLSEELFKAQSQTVRNVSGLSHDVDRLMLQVQGMQGRMQSMEGLLGRIEATLSSLSRGISATLLPQKQDEKPGERPVSAEGLEKELATALAPLLAELVEIRLQRTRDSSLAQVEQQILLTELRRLRSVALPPAERTTNPLPAVGKIPRRTSPR